MNLIYHIIEISRFASNDNENRFKYLYKQFFIFYKSFLKHMSYSIIDFMC
jgi:hypothetical protein